LKKNNITLLFYPHTIIISKPLSPISKRLRTTIDHFKKKYEESYAKEFLQQIFQDPALKKFAKKMFKTDNAPSSQGKKRPLEAEQNETNSVKKTKPLQAQNDQHVSDNDNVDTDGATAEDLVNSASDDKEVDCMLVDDSEMGFNTEKLEGSINDLVVGESRVNLATPSPTLQVPKPLFLV
jgi:hypothetical protein